jgi:guanosine-3',5'-bis(diphosphate) 3'-pyrophosphohydrolase
MTPIAKRQGIPPPSEAPELYDSFDFPDPDRPGAGLGKAFENEMTSRVATILGRLIVQPESLDVSQSATEQPLNQIMRALSFAAAKHRDQRRKDVQASPYINHPIALANILTVEVGVTDPAVICAAVLHDTVEDTETTVEELVDQFGVEISSIVAEVTDDKTLLKRERKQRQIQHAGTVSEKARLVKLADKIANLRDIAASPPADWDVVRKREYFDWAAQVVNRIRGTHPALEALFDAAARARP